MVRDGRRRRVDDCDFQHPNVDIDESSIKFQATGCSGSRGEQLYSFEVELYGQIDAKVSWRRSISIINDYAG